MNNIFAFFLFSVLKLRERVSCSPGWQPDKVEHSPMHKSRKLINDRTVGKRMWVRDSRERKLAGGCTVFLRISRRAGRVNRSVNFLPVPMALMPLFFVNWRRRLFRNEFHSYLCLCVPQSFRARCRALRRTKECDKAKFQPRFVLSGNPVSRIIVLLERSNECSITATNCN